MIAAVVERCTGIDVGKKSISVCVMVGPADQDPQTKLCTYHARLRWTHTFLHTSFTPSSSLYAFSRIVSLDSRVPKYLGISFFRQCCSK
ncbi:MAG TPA: hypothetical protein VK638_28890 [Edaphobacter sp.]|nr:hypothetical protein [Edaphobacter sp.]